MQTSEASREVVALDRARNSALAAADLAKRITEGVFGPFEVTDLMSVGTAYLQVMYTRDRGVNLTEGGRSVGEALVTLIPGWPQESTEQMEDRLLFGTVGKELEQNVKARGYSLPNMEEMLARFCASFLPWSVGLPDDELMLLRSFLDSWAQVMEEASARLEESAAA